MAVKSTQWSVDGSGPAPKVIVDESILKQGDVVRVKLSPYTPSVAELSFDPAVSDTDPFQLTQYKLDIPYVTEISRDKFDKKTITNYYYWVKNKTTIGAPGQLSTTSITNLLGDHDGIYAIPQQIKFFNQLDGRPNRYSILSVKNLGLEVNGVNSFKLRLNKDPTLRDDDKNISLKPAFAEWRLLRAGQVELIPILLWNTLIDTLTGSTQTGQALPYAALSLYDQKNDSSVSYGVDVGQVMTRSGIAKATLKYTVLNTKVYKYENGVLVPDYISYPGFDINQLDSYLSSPESIKLFMADLWRFAKSTQVNEIFFEVLQDLAAMNLELDMFFKTSYIALSDIRTTVID